MVNRLFIILLLATMARTAMAQAPRASYGQDDFSFSHELNPAVTPDQGYWSLPLIGNTSGSLSSSLKLGDLFYDIDHQTVTTFMNSAMINKSDFMKRVGKGMNTGVDTRVTLASVGRRVDSKRYQVYSLAWRTRADVYLDNGLFDVMKDVVNRLYTIDNTSVRASSYMELAYGESRRIDNHWSVGLKAKLLLGMVNADAEIYNMNIDLSTGKWIVQGNAKMNVSGLEYKTKTNDYKGREGTYTSVSGMKISSIGLHGVGAAIDAGASYKLDDHWSFSAAVLDFGVLSWFNTHKAQNNGEAFEFDGFHEVTTSKRKETSLKTQVNNIVDQLMDVVHLEETSTGSNTQLLAFNVNAGATYRYDMFSASALFTQRIYGHNSSWEGRLNLSAKPLKWLDATISPAYSSFGFALGGMLRFNPGRCQVYVATDCFNLKINRQYIPVSLNTTINFGMTMPL